MSQSKKKRKTSAISKYGDAFACGGSFVQHGNSGVNIQAGTIVHSGNGNAIRNCVVGNTMGENVLTVTGAKMSLPGKKLDKPCTIKVSIKYDDGDKEEKEYKYETPPDTFKVEVHGDAKDVDMTNGEITVDGTVSNMGITNGKSTIGGNVNTFKGTNVKVTVGGSITKISGVNITTSFN